MSKKRAIIIVIDSMGIGALEDAEEYGDSLKCNTLCNLARANGGIEVPNMEAMGLGNIRKITGVNRVKNPKEKTQQRAIGKLQALFWINPLKLIKNFLMN